MIIGLSGYAGSGKDTVGAMLVEHYGYKRLSFAQALKDVLEDVNPRVGAIDRLATKTENTTPKMTCRPLRVSWEHAKKEPEVRRLLQALGVACRTHIGPDVWVDAVMRQYDALQSKPHPTLKGFCSIVPVVITDVRFPNEAEAIVNRGGQVWRVMRLDHGPVNGHESETALDDWPFDRKVWNTSDLHSLRRTVEKMMA